MKFKPFNISKISKKLRQETEAISMILTTKNVHEKNQLFRTDFFM